MIHVVVGTKAQLIKMAPIMVELQKRGHDYNFILTGQHKDTIGELFKNFGLKEPDFVLHQGKDITGIAQMFLWSIRILLKAIINKKALWREDKNGVVLNHGDTFTTLLGSLLAKLSGHKNAHIESGLRSYNLFHPFPEELTRILVFHLTDYYFAPGDWALDNLKKYSGIKVNTQLNTLFDTLTLATTEIDSINIHVPDHAYVVVSIHRFENIFSKPQLTKLIGYINKISEEFKVLFILHSPTRKKLKEFNLYTELEANTQIELRPRYDYFQFIKLVKESEFIITDGGSNQEECFYMGKPCLLFREATERQEGLNKNVALSNYEEKTIEKFIQHYGDYANSPFNANHKKPSDIIIDNLLSFI